MDAAAREAVELESLGMPCQAIDRETCTSLEPGLGPVADTLIGGLHFPREEVGDCHKFARVMSQRCRTLASISAGIPRSRGWRWRAGAYRRWLPTRAPYRRKAWSCHGQLHGPALAAGRGAGPGLSAEGGDGYRAGGGLGRRGADRCHGTIRDCSASSASATGFGSPARPRSRDTKSRRIHTVARPWWDNVLELFSRLRQLCRGRRAGALGGGPGQFARRSAHSGADVHRQSFSQCRARPPGLVDLLRLGQAGRRPGLRRGAGDRS